jgi:hypothetical protein
MPQNAETPFFLLQQIISNYTVQLQCLQHVPGRRVTPGVERIFSELVFFPLFLYVILL